MEMLFAARHYHYKNVSNIHHFRGMKIIFGVCHSVDLVMYLEKNLLLIMTCVNCRISFLVMFWQDRALEYNPNIYTI